MNNDIYSLTREEQRMTGITFDTGTYSSIEQARIMLGSIPKAANKAIGSALVRTVTSTKAFAAKAVRSEYFIKSSDFKKHTFSETKFQKDQGNTRIDLIFRGTHIPLMEFNTKVGRDGRVYTRVKRSNPQSVLEHAFKQHIGSHIGIFERETSKKLPIHEMLGPSVPQMLSANESLQYEITDHAHATFDERLRHEITAILNGWRKV
ncbi:MAG: hypothetical protein ACI4OB_06995 [Christensenellales bacterium]